MRNRRLILSLAVALVAANGLLLPARAQGVWEKPYRQWTMADLETILGDSPWAQTQLRSGGVSSDSVPLNSSTSAGHVTVRLRSALPVRQGLVRLRQLKAKYDKMSATEQAAFDAKTATLLECPACADNYVVSLGPPSRLPNGMPSSLQNMSLAAVKLHVHLLDEKGEERELVHFEPPKAQGEEAVFFFSRLDARGRPLLTGSTKKIIVAIAPQVLTGGMAGTRRFEFDVSKMAVNGAPSF